MYNPYDLLPSEFDNAVFPELYKDYNYGEYDYKTYKKEVKKLVDKREKMTNKFNVTNRTGNQIVVKLDDGTTVSGTVVQVTKTLKALGYDANLEKTYKSSTNGTVLISSMPTPHIRNAVAKQIQVWLDGLKKLDNADFYEEVYNKLDMPFWDNEFINLVEELQDRDD